MAEEEDIELGRRLRKLRRACGISAAELARKIGVSQQQMSKYESGQNRVSYSTLVKIAIILQLPPCAFFYD